MVFSNQQGGNEDRKEVKILLLSVCPYTIRPQWTLGEMSVGLLKKKKKKKKERVFQQSILCNKLCQYSNIYEIKATTILLFLIIPHNSLIWSSLSWMVLLFLVAYARDRRSQCSCSLMFCVSLEIVQTARCQSSIFLCVLEASNTAIWGSLPWSLNSKKSTFQCRRCKRHGFDPWVRNTPWSRKWQPTPVLAGKSCGGGGDAWWATLQGLAKS